MRDPRCDGGQLAWSRCDGATHLALAPSTAQRRRKAAQFHCKSNIDATKRVRRKIMYASRPRGRRHRGVSHGLFNLLLLLGRHVFWRFSRTTATGNLATVVYVRCTDDWLQDSGGGGATAWQHRATAQRACSSSKGRARVRNSTGTQHICAWSGTIDLAVGVGRRAARQSDLWRSVQIYRKPAIGRAHCTRGSASSSLHRGASPM